MPNAANSAETTRTRAYKLGRLLARFRKAARTSTQPYEMKGAGRSLRVTTGNPVIRPAPCFAAMSIGSEITVKKCGKKTNSAANRLDQADGMF